MPELGISTEKVGFLIEKARQFAIPAINRALDFATTRYPNLHIIDMNRRFAFHPELLISDGIHFDLPGIIVFSQLVAAALPNES